MAVTMKRAAYADMFGPTTGDRVRLADTDLIIEVEKDLTVYGEEVKFGGGKVIRDGMGQSQATNKQGAVDTVITNALILDYWGIVKSASSGEKVAARLSPPDSISTRSRSGNLARMSATAARLIEASSRIAVCGQPPVSIPRMRSGGSEPARVRNSASSLV